MLLQQWVRWLSLTALSVNVLTRINCSIKYSLDVIGTGPYIGLPAGAREGRSARERRRSVFAS